MLGIHFILYVKDQEKSKEFYSTVLDQTPSLHVPGMTEFRINSSTVLGLMPEKGIQKLLGDKLPNPEQAHGIPRTEVYLEVDRPSLFHERSIKAGGKELSKLEERGWGATVAYSMDPDGHVLAFACQNEYLHQRWRSHYAP